MSDENLITIVCEYHPDMKLKTFDSQIIENKEVIVNPCSLCLLHEVAETRRLILEGVEEYIKTGINSYK